MALVDLNWKVKNENPFLMMKKTYQLKLKT